LFITAAKEIDVLIFLKAILIQVPYRKLTSFQNLQQRLVRELERKFPGKDIFFVADRRIMPVPTSGMKKQRPRSRTLTSVYDAILEDLVYPNEIVGKRIRYRIDGSKVQKVYLEPKNRNISDYKLKSLRAVYGKLTGKKIKFISHFN